MSFTKFFTIFLFVSIFCSNIALAEDASVENTKNNEIVSLDLAKGRIGEFLELLENTRIHYAEVFLKVRDENKEKFSTIEIKDLDKQPVKTDVAGVPASEGVKMPNSDQLKEHFVEYILYFLTSSLYSFFSSKAIFYVGLVLFVFLSLRFILRRFL